MRLWENQKTRLGKCCTWFFVEGQIGGVANKLVFIDRVHPEYHEPTQ